MDTLRTGLVALFATLSAFATADAVAATSETNPVLQQPAAATESAVHRVFVKLRSNATAGRDKAQATTNTVQALVARSKLTLMQTREISAGLHALQVQPIAGESIAATLARLRTDPNVEYAEADERRYPHALSPPDDPLFTGQWYLQNAQPSGVDAVTAWNTTTGRSDIVIADVDTGIRFDHPDLRSVATDRLLAGYDFISDAAIANDGNGRDADATDPGDWVTTADTQTAKFTGCTVQNSSWHGTRVVGMMAAIANNSTGIAGITWQGMILPVRALGKCGGYDSDIMDGMRWAAGLHVSGAPDNTHPAQIINMSLGSIGSCTAAQQQVVDEIVALGVLIVVSAGNEGGPVDSPANCIGVAGVAGLRNIGTKVGFSSLGPQVALSAPGGNCVNASGACLFSLDTTTNSGTTVPVASTYTDQFNSNLGTSFSAPAVASIAALMTSVNGNLQPSQLIARLQEGAKPFPTSPDPTIPSCHVPASSADIQSTECNCTTTTCGAGMANAPGAVNAALRPIAAVVVPGVVMAGQNVILRGIGSAAACGHSIVSFAWTNVPSSANAIQGANTSTATVVAPTSGSYTVRLTVVDDAGRQDTADVVVSATAAATSAFPTAQNTAGCVSTTVAVTPATVSLEVSGGYTFTAAVTNASNTAVTWQVNGTVGGNATLGTISTAGVYTAPASVPTPATLTVTAVSAADTTKSASSQVTITPAIAISISPTSAVVPVASGKQTFSATVTNSTNTAVIWQVNGVTGGNSTVGTISNTGAYTAPSAVPSSATVTVTAISSADSNRSASAQVTVGSPTVTVSGSSSGGSGSGGGAFDALTLLAYSLAAGAALLRRQRQTPY